MDIKLGKYRHFKGNEYEVVAIAKHSETLEEMVVYKDLKNEGKVSECLAMATTSYSLPLK